MADSTKKPTRRQMEILQMAADGTSSTDIAEETGLAQLTVDKHFSDVYKRMNVSGRVRAVVVAIKNKWIVAR